MDERNKKSVYTLYNLIAVSQQILLSSVSAHSSFISLVPPVLLG